MNATLDRVARWTRALGLAGLTGLTAGCMSYDPFNQAIDATSSAAGRVEVLARADQSYPTWADFPAEPQNVPTAADIRNRVLALEADETQLNREVAAIGWTLGADDGDPWARRTRNRIDPRLSQPADPQAVAEALAWAQRMRERSAPPPPINH